MPSRRSPGRTAADVGERVGLVGRVRSRAVVRRAGRVPDPGVAGRGRVVRRVRLRIEGEREEDHLAGGQQGGVDRVHRDPERPLGPLAVGRRIERGRRASPSAQQPPLAAGGARPLSWGHPLPGPRLRLREPADAGMLGGMLGPEDQTLDVADRAAAAGLAERGGGQGAGQDRDARRNEDSARSVGWVSQDSAKGPGAEGFTQRSTGYSGAQERVLRACDSGQATFCSEVLVRLGSCGLAMNAGSSVRGMKRPDVLDPT